VPILVETVIFQKLIKTQQCNQQHLRFMNKMVVCIKIHYFCACFTVIKFKINLNYSNYEKITTYESDMQEENALDTSNMQHNYEAINYCLLSS
jgi:hypothetical protein